MINKTCPLVLRDLYYYDIVSAFPTLMDQQHYDFGKVDLNNKEERNIFIGKQQINNKNLSGFLNESIKDLTNFYLQYNEIDDENVIFKQKDGFIINKMLTKNNSFIEMKLRFMITLLIIDVDREKILYFDDSGNMTVKGVRHYYQRLNDIYKKFYELNFYDKSILALQLQNIKDTCIQNKDITFYGIDEDDDGRMMFLYKNGKSITTRDVDFIEPEKINKCKYFDFYFKPFTDSVFMEAFYEK